MSLLSKLYDKKISSKGLGVFRVLFTSVLLLEVVRIFRFRQLYYDPLPFIQRNLLASEIAFTIWICVLFMLIIGAYTRISALINYIFVLIFISHIGTYEYHMDYTYIGVSFLMIFIPVSKSYSIDRVIFKLKYKFSPIQKTSVLSYWLIIFIGIGLIYITSTILKIQSNAWLNGLGLWLPASIPQITIIDNQWLLNQEFLIKFLGYFTLVFEFIFLLLFWRKSFRTIIFFIGVILHLGILIEFPIPYFALGYIAIYTLLIPVSFWNTIESKLKLKATKLKSLYDDLYSKIENKNYFNSMGNLNQRELKPNIFPRRKTKLFGIKIFIITVLVTQFLTEIKNPFNDGIAKNIYSNINKASSKFLGVSQHSVFLDGHYNDYDAIYTLKYNDEYLPLFDQYGMPDDYIKGGIWADFGFRVNRPNSEKHMANLKNGLSRYASFYAHKKGINLNDATFTILKKEVRVSYQWEPNLLLENRTNPWREVGEMIWKNKTAEVSIKVD